MINNVMDKFADVRKGLYDTHYEISGKQPTQQTEEAPRQAISLIDLDEDSNTSDVPVATSNNALNELSDIFGSTGISSPPAPKQPDIFASTPTAQPSKQPDIFDLLGGGIPTTTSMSATSSPVIASPSLHNTSMPSHRTPSPQLEVTDVVKKGKRAF